MKDINGVQCALINIFKASFQNKPLEHLLKTCHLELEKLIGHDRAKNFYLALYEGGGKYLIPYFQDEKDDGPVDEPISLEGGMTEYIRKSGRTELIDAERHRVLMTEGLVSQKIGSGSHQWIGAPIASEGEVQGVLVLQTYDKNVFYSAEDVELVDYISKNIALAIERRSKELQLDNYRKNLEDMVQEKSLHIIKKNAGLKRKISIIKKNEQIQKVLYEISESKNKTKNLYELIKKIHEQVATLMDATNFFVAIVEDKEKALYRFPFFIDENPSEIKSPDFVYDLSNGYTHYVLMTERPLLLDGKNRSKDGNTLPPGLGKKCQSWLGIPLKTDSGEILGVVAVQSYINSRAYTRVDQKILSIISTTIAGAVQYKQLEAEKASLEDKLLESQKMEAVGILAAGVAHEFNNLLSIIIGYSYSGIKASHDDPEMLKRFNKIEKSAERASELIDKLMVFAKKRERGRCFIDNMTMAVQKVLNKMKERVPEGSRIEVHMDEDLWPLKIDIEEIDDILSNVIDNALRAVAGKSDGLVSITVQNFNGRPGSATLTEKCKYIYIKIEDNGIGMDHLTLEQIFNPFFTTRNPGEGTGLGLAIVYTIIQEYYGTITVESKPNLGTTAHIYLPITSILS